MKIELLEEESSLATQEKLSLSSVTSHNSIPDSLIKLINDVQTLNRQLLNAVRS